MKSAKTCFIIRFVALVLISQVFFLGFFVISRQLDPDTIVFYSGLRTVGYSAMIFFGLLWLVRRFCVSALSWIELQLTLPVAVIYVLLGYCFIITIPTLLDRAISVYMIAVVAQSGARGLSKAEIQEGFLRDYVEGGFTVEKRLNEQLVSGFFVEHEGQFLVTDKGRFVYDVNRFLARLFRIPTKYTEPPDHVRE